MANLLEQDLARPGHFIVREANGYRSRDGGIIASGSGKLKSGAVLGQVTASKKFKPLDPAANDGSQNAKAVLFEGCDATDADVKRTLVARDCEVVGDLLAFADGVTDAQKTTALADLASAGIVAR